MARRGFRGRVFVGVVVRDDDALAREEGERVLAALHRLRIPHERFDRAEDATGDLLVAVGDNPYLLSVFRRAPGSVPVLGVGSAGFGVLTETTVEGFESAVKRVAAGDFWVEDVARLDVKVGDRARALALNEAAVVAAQPGQFVRYSLWVADELVWRDRGDGLIVATPTGSTAYALAAGGPIVLAKTRVFSVVPICSSEGNRPLIVEKDATLSVTDAWADAGVDVVADGRERLRVARGERITFARSTEPARFVRLGEKRYTQMLGKMKMARGDAPGSLKDAPPSAKFVVKLLEYEGPLTQQEMIRESELSERTVRNAVAWLLEHGAIQKEPSLRDARQDVYTLRARRS